MRGWINLNRALLAKWSWHYAEERGASWHRVNRRKYKEGDGGWRTCEVVGAYEVSVWKVIRMD